MMIRLRTDNIKLNALYLVKDKKVLAYALGRNYQECKNHLNLVKEFHRLEGEIVEDNKLDKEFEKYINYKIQKDVTPNFINLLLKKGIYKRNDFYLEVLKIRKGKTVSYSYLSKLLKIPIPFVVKLLKMNPFPILIPCHRIIRKDGNISGYTPLGQKFKELLLKLENDN